MKRKYYTKKVPKCRSLTLEQIYGLPNDNKAKKQCKEIGGNDKEFLESLKEIGRLEERKKGSVNRGKGI